MTKNVGSKDKMVRIVIALVFGLLYVTGVVSGVLGLILVVVALVLVITSITGFCGLYKLLGINTCPMKTTQGQANPQDLAQNPAQNTPENNSQNI